MKFIQDAQAFEIMKPYFISANYHRYIEGSKKVFQLSLLIDGIETIIKKSSKDIVHAGFDQVITGAVLRMNKLFSEDGVNLEVLLFKKPSISKLEISFELVNKNVFKIGNEEYYASIMCEYSYEKMDSVTYYLIIYREVCSNGQVSIMSKNFKETVGADKIFQIGCEWSRCTFETFQDNLNDYYAKLKNEVIDYKDEKLFEQEIIKKMEDVLGINLTREFNEMEMVRSESFQPDPLVFIRRNLEIIGKNQFAVWNTITDFASREVDVNKRNAMFLNAGKYLANQMEKTVSIKNISFSENLKWSQVLGLVKNKID